MQPSTAIAHVVPFNASRVVVRTEDLPDNVPPLLAMRWAGYPGRNAKRFLAEARRTGLRVWEINSRVLRIDRDQLLEWRKRNTV